MARVPRLRQTQSNKVQRVPSLSSQPMANDCMDPAWRGGQETQAKPGRPLPAHGKLHTLPSAEAASSWCNLTATGREKEFCSSEERANNASRSTPHSSEPEELGNPTHPLGCLELCFPGLCTCFSLW